MEELTIDELVEAAKSIGIDADNAREQINKAIEIAEYEELNRDLSVRQGELLANQKFVSKEV